MSQYSFSSNQQSSLYRRKGSKMSFGNHVGTSSILLIFVVLCFVSFAVLSLVSAHADYLLSKKIADRTAAYYNACSLAEHTIQDFMQQNQQNTFSQNALSHNPAETTALNVQFPITEHQWLQLTIENHDGRKYLSEYRLSINTEDMDFNESLPVLSDD